MSSLERLEDKGELTGLNAPAMRTAAETKVDIGDGCQIEERERQWETMVAQDADGDLYAR